MGRGSQSVLRELGVKPIINACGTLTILGGTTLADEISEAWAEASRVYLDMNELHTKAGEFISKLTGAESAYITAGTAASLVISIATCIIRAETGKMAQLPKTQGMRNEVIVQRLHHNESEFLFEIAGAEVVEIGDEYMTTHQELEDAICERTAAVAYFAFDPQEGVLPLETVLEISHRHGVSVMNTWQAQGSDHDEEGCWRVNKGSYEVKESLFRHLPHGSKETLSVFSSRLS